MSHILLGLLKRTLVLTISITVVVVAAGWLLSRL
jgi:hypothetical protein